MMLKQLKVIRHGAYASGRTASGEIQGADWHALSVFSLAREDFGFNFNVDSECQPMLQADIDFKLILKDFLCRMVRPGTEYHERPDSAEVLTFFKHCQKLYSAVRRLKENRHNTSGPAYANAMMTFNTEKRFFEPYAAIADVSEQMQKLWKEKCAPYCKRQKAVEREIRSTKSKLHSDSVTTREVRHQFADRLAAQERWRKEIVQNADYREHKKAFQKLKARRRALITAVQKKYAAVPSGVRAWFRALWARWVLKTKGTAFGRVLQKIGAYCGHAISLRVQQQEKIERVLSEELAKPEQRWSNEDEKAGSTVTMGGRKIVASRYGCGKGQGEVISGQVGAGGHAPSTSTSTSSVAGTRKQIAETTTSTPSG